MSDSILDTIKEMVVSNVNDGSFDVDLIVLINNSFSKLVSMGVGPKEGFLITDNTAVWADFLGDRPELIPTLQAYIFASVKISFDMTASTVIRDVYTQIANENSWRLQIECDKT